MLIDGKTIEELTEADLLQMVERRRPDDQYIEFKQENYDDSDNEKTKKLLKHVSAFANASGGMLLLGVAETNSTASDLLGVDLLNPQKQVESMQQKITSGLEPILSGIRIKPIPLSSGKYVVAIAVPQSINRPHRAVLAKGGRFCIRRNSESTDMTYDELKRLFLDSAGVEDRVRQMQEKSRDAFGAEKKQFPSAGSGTLALHVMPLSARGRTLDVRANLAQQRANFLPRAPENARWSANFKGIGGGWERRAQPNTGHFDQWERVQIHRNGMIENWSGSYFGGRRQMYGSLPQGNRTKESYYVFEVGRVFDHVFCALPAYLRGLEAAGFYPPYAVTLTLLDFTGPLEIEIHKTHSTDHAHNILLEPIYLEQPALTGEWRGVLRPIFDQMWNAFGQPACPYFDDDGNWRGAST
jgi:hypothetical protein